MRKILVRSLYATLILISNFIIGCSKKIELKFQEKTYEELYDELQNTTLEVEVVKEGKRNIFYYSNNDNLYIYTIRYEYGEFGYIYDSENKNIYNLDKNKISLNKENVTPSNYIEKVLKKTSFLLYLQLDKSKFEFIEVSNIANRECYKYRYENKSEVYHFYIDKETSLCLKCIYFVNGEVDLYFETKTFLYDPNIEVYSKLIENYNKEQNNPNTNENK